MSLGSLRDNVKINQSPDELYKYVPQLCIKDDLHSLLSSGAPRREHFLICGTSSYGDFSLIAPESKYRKMGVEKMSFPGTPGTYSWDVGALDAMWIAKNPSREAVPGLIFTSPSVWPAVWGKPKTPWGVSQPLISDFSSKITSDYPGLAFP